jgi:ribosomal-protein-alanine N-acetyltransferase
VNAAYVFDIGNETPLRVGIKTNRATGSKVNDLDRLSLIRTLHPFWSNFRVGGDPPATCEDVRNDLRKCLDEWAIMQQPFFSMAVVQIREPLLSGYYNETMTPLPLITERLLLREFCLEDQAAVHAYASDPEVTKHTSWGPNNLQTTRAVLGQWVMEQNEWPRTSIPLGIELCAEKKLVGGTGFASIADGTGVFGFVLHRNYWGAGIATEASRALLKFGFETLGLHRIVAECFVEQTVSIRIFEKLRMRREDHFLKNARKAGIWRDTYLYAVLEDEWRSYEKPVL